MSHSTEPSFWHSFEVLDGGVLTSATGGADVEKRTKMFDTLRKVITDYSGTEKSVISRTGR